MRFKLRVEIDISLKFFFLINIFKPFLLTYVDYKNIFLGIRLIVSYFHISFEIKFNYM